VSPLGACVLQDTSNFFTDFLVQYESIDDLKGAIEMVCDDIYIIVQGFEICKKIHEPILIAAELNKIRARVVSEEIGNKFDSLNDDYQVLVDKVQELDKQAKKNNPSMLWKLLPAAAWTYI
jgi:hypothetical protein